MTGFGKAEIQFENKSYVLELRSLNSKGLEMNARLPVYVREIEIQLKKSIGKFLKRGKIDLNLNIENMRSGIEQAPLLFLRQDQRFYSSGHLATSG